MQRAVCSLWASLGPFTIEELFDYLGFEYPTASPFDRADVERFLADESAVLMSGGPAS